MNASGEDVSLACASGAAACLESIKQYREYATREVERVRRNLTGLSPDDQASLVWKASDQVQTMEEAVAKNSAFLDKLVEGIQSASTAAAETDRALGGLAVSLPTGTKPVQVLLQTLTREWTVEGEPERRECFKRLLGALDSHLGTQRQQAVASGAQPPRVLCPGSQLGRLAFEVQRQGFTAEACEQRVLNFLTAEFVRQRCTQRDEYCIQPFALQTCNRFKKEDHVRATPLPDAEIDKGSLPVARFGDFVQLYDTASSKASFDAMLTSFALDTSSNIFRYVRVAAHVIRPGGVWSNFGPLAYDQDHDDSHGHGLELSWEELRHAISHFFEVKDEDFVDALHAANGESMMQMQYSCISFVAVRNETPSPGIGTK